MSQNIPITDEFDDPWGKFNYYDAYSDTDRDILIDQKHTDIRSFATDENWNQGVIGKQSDRKHWQGYQLSCTAGQIKFVISVINGSQGLADDIDLKTNWADDEWLSIALPAFPLSSLDVANSFFQFTSNSLGNFTLGPVASIPFNASVISLINGDSEFRVPLSVLNGIDRQHVTGVRFVVKATANCTFRCLAIRALGKNWKYATLDTDTRLHILKPTVAPDGSATRDYDWYMPSLYRSATPSGFGDPKPINMSVGIAFNSGTRTNSTTINLFFRENTKMFTQMIDLEGVELSQLEGKPMPETGLTNYRPRTQKELDGLKQSDLDGRTQLDLERTGDPSLSSFITAALSWQGTAATMALLDAESNGYNFTDLDGLAANTWYIFIVDLDGISMRARLYPLDTNGNLVTTQIVYDTGTIYDDFIFVRRAGRFGWQISVGDGDIQIDGIRTRRTVFGELETQPFESITPVTGCELHVVSSNPVEYFDDVFPTDSISPVTLIRDSDRSTTGSSWQVTNPGLTVNTGIQTNLADFFDFAEMEISLDLFYPSSASTIPLSAFLSNDHGRIIPLNMGSLLYDQWQHVVIEPGHPTAQTGRYRFYLVQTTTGNATTWWVDNFSINERVVSFYGRSELEDPWGDQRIDWVPFKNYHSKDSTGIQFTQRGNNLQIRAAAHRQDVRINSIRTIPIYAHLGRFVWEEDELYNPLAPIAAFSTSISSRTVTFNGTTSSDADGYIVNYQWSFGDGMQASGPIVIHTYTHPGDFYVSLIVTDSNGLRSQHTATVTVT